MAKSTLKISYLAKIVSNDVFLDSLLQAQGPNQAQFLEKLEKNRKFARTQGIAIKIVYTIMFTILPILPLLTYLQITAYSQNGSMPPAAILFAGGFLVGFYFVLEIVYLLVFGIIYTSTLLSGEGFKWLETLPISRETRQKVCLSACFRSIDVPLVSLVISLPVIMAIVTGNAILVIICVGTSLLNVIFSFSILVIFSERFNRLTKNNEKNTKKSNIVRIVSMLTYIFASFGIGLMVNIAIQSIGKVFSFFASTGNLSDWIYIFSIIPFPFAPGFLITAASMNTGDVTANSWISMIIGVGILILLTCAVYRRAIGVLKHVVVAKVPGTSKPAKFKVQEKVKLMEIVPRTAVQAFRRKDLETVGRDMQALTFLMFPLIMPFITIIPFLAVIHSDQQNIAYLSFTIWNLLLLMSCFVIGGMITGFVNLETAGSTLLASLPVVTRDQAKAKLSVMIPLQLIGILVPTFLLLTNPLFSSLFVIIVASIPVILAMLLSAFILKTYLFGRLKYKYVLEDVRLRYKPIKWIIIFAAMVGIWAVVAFPGFTLFQAQAVIPLILLLLVSGGVAIAISASIFNRMFPRRPNRDMELSMVVEK